MAILDSIAKFIDNIARYAIASLFYFELDLVPDQYNREYLGIGFILCLLRQGDLAFKILLDQLSKSSATFYLNHCPNTGTVRRSLHYY
jgi:hypothetical protein